MSNKTDEILDKFLEGSLSATQLADFEKQLQTDPALANALAVQLTIRKQLRDEARKEVAINLDQALQGKNRQLVLLRPYHIVLVAASILLLIIAGLSIFSHQQQEIFTNKEGLQALNGIIKANQIDLVNAGEGSKVELLLKYKAELAQKSNPGDYKDLNYYVGAYNLYAEKNFQAAIVHLKCVEAPQNGGQHFRPNVPYLLVLAYTGAGNVDTALSLIKKYKLRTDQWPIKVRRKLGL